jgi:hypothetical protein
MSTQGEITMGLFDGDRRRGRRRGLIVGAAAGAAVAKHRNKEAQASDTGQTETEAPGDDGNSDSIRTQLAELQGLRDDNLISDSEYQTKKKQILGI